MKYLGYPFENFHIPWGFRWFLGTIPIILFGIPLWIISLGMIKTPRLFSDWLNYCVNKKLKRTPLNDF